MRDVLHPIVSRWIPRLPYFCLLAVFFIAAQPEPATAQAPPPNRVPYLRDLEQENIFDPGKGETLSPIQRTAIRLAEQGLKGGMQSVSEIRNLITYEYILSGDDEEAVIEEAMVRALQSATSRLYFEDYFLLGRDLLEPYLRRHGRQFLARTSILDRRILTGDRFELRIRLSVNLDTLYQDLADKRFISGPNVRPIISVHLNELVNGESQPSVGGRARIEQTLGRYLFRVFSDKMREPALDADLSSDPQLLRTARLEAQRNNVDILISGTLSVRPIEQEQILYDDYAFQEAEVALKVYRVDSGQVIAEFHDRFSATGSATDKATEKVNAITNVLDAMLPRITRAMAEDIGWIWPNMMLDQADYRIMVSGVDQEMITGIYNLLSTLSPELKIFQKSYYGDVLVFNLDFPGAQPGQLEQFLRSANEPQFEVNPIDPRHFELEVL